MEGYAPGTECAECRGKCCRENGCCLSPEDLFRALSKINETINFRRMLQRELKEHLLTLLKDEEGLYAIDRTVSSKGPFYYLRMRHKCYTFVGVDAMGECVALTDVGCRLSGEERPKGGRFLKSSPDRHCVQMYTMEEMCTDWEPYQKLLSEIYLEYEAIFKEDGTFDKCDQAYFAWMREQREKMQRKNSNK
ncbi:MAG: hypothetical protein IJ409_05160 [Lachnospiraceae bacterium]|nr:hypothetical protein [Lachnospiraceae bacterium]